MGTIDGKFPQPQSKIELTQEELEGLLEIKIDPSLSLRDILDLVKDGSGEGVRFIITENLDLFLSLHQHNELARIIGVNREECPLPDGFFRIDEDSEKIEFIYHTWVPEKIKYIREAANSKIKKFLRSKGVEFND